MLVGIKMEKITVILIILVSIVLNAIGQVSLKYGMNAYGPVEFSNLSRVFFMFFNPFVFFGLCCYVLSTIFWLVSLSNADLSFVYPLVTVSIVLVIILSRFVFNESFNASKISGILLVILGVFLISIGRIKQ